MARPDPHSFRDDTQPVVLYDALGRNPDTRTLAQECFERNRGQYHPIAVTVISTRLSQADGG